MILGLRPKSIFHIIYDIFAVNTALFLAYYFRLGNVALERLDDRYLYASAIASLIFVSVFLIFRFYKIVWIYASYEDYFYGLTANLTAGFIFLVSQILLKQVILSLTVLAMIFTAIITIGGRIFFRAFQKYREIYLNRTGKIYSTLIIGNFSFAIQLAKKIKYDNRDKLYPIGLVVDEKFYKGRYISGVPVLGSLNDLEEIIREKNPKVLLLALADYSDNERNELIERVKSSGKVVKISEKQDDFTGTKKLSEAIKNISIDELYGKREIQLSKDEALKQYRDKTILIIGAAGDMGSRIAQKVLDFSPQKIILLDVNENRLEKLVEKLSSMNSPAKIFPIIMSTNDNKGIDNLFHEEKPEIVFHCAFLNKHSLSDKNPKEVVKNNLIGTYYVVESAGRHGVEKLITLSTNYAKNPKDMISASKRICEMLLQAAGKKFETVFSSVRFPDLSNNAYADLDRFKSELEKNGSLTIGNEEEKMILFGYKDAVCLIIKCLMISQGGEVFVLNPGEEVPVRDLAETFLNHHQVQDNIKREINIIETGEVSLRDIEPPVNYRELNPTDDERIYTGRYLYDDYHKIKLIIQDLVLAIEKGEGDVVEHTVMKNFKELMPTYQFANYDGVGYYLPSTSVVEDKGKKIWLSSPHMGGMEKFYVDEAFQTNWIAPIGPNVNEFEREIADYLGVKAAAAMISGTAAIHIALRILGIKQGEEVFCSTLTFSGSANPIMYEKAIPVFIDAEPDSWNMSPVALKKALQDRKKKGKLPKAVIVVNLYGQSSDFDPIIKLCDDYDVPIIEDAAESLGATYHGRQTGTFGKFGILSFNGNKIITTSGGGMLVSDDETAIRKAKFLITQARDPARHYQHSEVGYNYRMSNIVAGIGRGQLKILDLRIKQKARIYEYYREAFKDIDEISLMPIQSFGTPNYWLSVITLRKNSKVSPLNIMLALEKDEIESRPVWKPMHLQPVFRSFDFFNHQESGLSVSQMIFRDGVCLPSDTNMNEDDLKRVCDIVRGQFK